MMNSDQIALFNAAFAKRTDLATLMLYLAGMMASQVKMDYPEVQGDYYDCFYMGVGSRWRAYLPESLLKELNREKLTFLCNIVSNSDGVDFFTHIRPGLIGGRDVKAIFSELGLPEHPSRQSLIYAIIKIFGILRLQADLILDEKWIGWLESYPSGNAEEFGDRLKSAFDELDWSVQYSKLIGFRDNLCRWWFVIVGAPFDPAPGKVSKRISGQLSRLKDSHTSDERILELFSIAQDATRFDEKIGDTYSYFQKVYLQSEGEVEDEEPGEKDAKAAGPGMRYFAESKLFEETLKKWKKVDTVDFLRALYFSSETEMVEQELCLCYPVLLGMIRKAQHGRVLLFNANPDFVSRCCSSAYNEKYAFLFTERILAELYKQRFPDGCFLYLDRTWLLVQVELDHTKRGRESYFRESLYEERFLDAMLFCRTGDSAQLAKLLTKMPEWLEQTARFYVLMPQSVVNSAPYDIRREMFSSFSCESINVFPNKRSDVQNFRKNMLVKLSLEDEHKEEIYLLRNNLYTLEGLGAVVCPDPWSVKIPVKELREGVRTVLELRKMYIPRTPPGDRRCSRTCRFSKEIVLDYSWSKGRGRFTYYAHRMKDGEYLFDTRYRGKRLLEHRTFRAKTVTEAERLICKNVFDEPLCGVIQKETESAYQGRPISLKTFWFISREELATRSVYSEQAAAKLFNSQALSDMMSDEKTSLELFTAIMDQDFSDEPQSERINLWRQLNCILSYAEKRPNFFKNPVRSHVLSLVNKDKGYIQVRKSLAKRSYEIEEEKRILNHIREHFKEDSRLVGAAISFYTGMNDREICALTWGDYQRIVGTDYCQFWVTKTMVRIKEKNGIQNSKGAEEKFGAQMLDPDNPYAYRRGPIVFELGALLDEYKQHVLEKYEALQTAEGVENAKFEELPLVGGRKDFTRYTDTGQLATARRELDRVAGVEEIIGSAAGKETDFNDYKDNRFRSNFRYRASQSCVMTRAEVHYILGIKRPTTFSEHYCDYTNDFVQLTLCRKLERWSQLHRWKSERETKAEKISSNQNRVRAHEKSHPRQCAEFDMEIQSQYEQGVDEKKLKVTVSCPGGVDVQVRRVRVKEK